jgi:hypothetical protein
MCYFCAIAVNHCCLKVSSHHFQSGCSAGAAAAGNPEGPAGQTPGRGSTSSLSGDLRIVAVGLSHLVVF